MPVMVYLMSGVRIQGYITGSDRFTLALTWDRQSHALYKHAISTIYARGRNRSRMRCRSSSVRTRTVQGPSFSA